MKQLYGYILCLLLAACPVYSWAGQEVSRASRINAKIDSLLTQLKVTSDSSRYYSTIANAVLLAIECDKLDEQHEYFQLNKDRLQVLRRRMINAVLSSSSMPAEITKRLVNVYLESSEDELFADDHVDAGRVAYQVSRKALADKDFAKADYYCDIALLYPAYAKNAAEVKVLCMRSTMSTAEDSTQYADALKELHGRIPENKQFFNLLMEYYSFPGREKLLSKFVHDEVMTDRDNLQAWLVLGELEMKKYHWAGSIASFEQALRIDSLSTHALFNLGICHSSRAIALKDSLVDDRGRLTRDERKEVRKAFECSRHYLEKVKEADPKGTTYQWMKPLYQVYYALNERSKAKALRQEEGKDW